MPEYTRDQFLALKERGQKALIEFLNLDIDLAFTFLETAKIGFEVNPADSATALDKVRAALVYIRQSQGHIEDSGEVLKIQERADQLEAALDKLSADLS